MNKTPSILVDTGFEVDQNGVMTGLVIPSVVDTITTPPSKVVINGTTIKYIPSTATSLIELVLNNATEITVDVSDPYKFCNGYAVLQTFRAPKLQTLAVSGNLNELGAFKGCSALTTIDCPELVTITENYASQTFARCTSLTSIYFPKLQSIAVCGHGTFAYCTALATVNLPRITTIEGANSYGVFMNCTSLTTVTLGSTGHPVSSIHASTFKNCTQSGLTITIYTADGNEISGRPWGATNASFDFIQA